MERRYELDWLRVLAVLLLIYLLAWSAGIPVKFMVISTMTLLETLGLYELLVRRFGPLRVCFGLKSDRKTP